MLRLLRQRNFALLWFGGLVSLLGDWALIAALPVYVYQLTGSTLATGAMVGAFMAPRLLLGSVAGVFVDRWDRRRTLVVANVLLAINVLALTAATSSDRLWVVFVVALIQSSLAQFVQPAEGALLPLLVPIDDRVPANALNALNNDLARLVGPAIGALTGVYVGLAGVALLDAATFLVAAGLIALIATDSNARQGIPSRSAAPSTESSVPMAEFWRQWCDGLRLVSRSRPLATMFAFMTIAGLGEGVMAALFAPFVVEVIGGAEPAYGWLLSAQAVGGLAGGAAIARWGAHVSPTRLVGVGGIAASTFDLLIFNSQALLPGLALPLLLMVVVGLPFASIGIGRTTLIQASTEDRYRGRVIGALATTAALSSLVGTFLGGVLGGSVGIVTMLNVQGTAYGLAGIMVLVRLRAPHSAGRPDSPSIGTDAR